MLLLCLIVFLDAAAMLDCFSRCCCYAGSCEKLLDRPDELEVLMPWHSAEQLIGGISGEALLDAVWQMCMRESCWKARFVCLGVHRGPESRAAWSPGANQAEGCHWQLCK